MKTARRILLYGNSVILGAVGISLERYSQFEVTKLALPLKETEKLAAAKIDIIVFDMQTTNPEAVLSLLEINPTIQLIGISPDINLVKVWSIRELREVSMQGLIELIKNELNDLTVESGIDGDRYW